MDPSGMSVAAICIGLSIWDPLVLQCASICDTVNRLAISSVFSHVSCTWQLDSQPQWIYKGPPKHR